MKMDKTALQFLEDHRQEAYELLLQLARIPAPSHHEHRRAEFCRDWLLAQGAKDVFIDEAQNVVWPVGCEGDKPVAVFMAHSDVVFPDTEPLPLRVEGGCIYCPGIGDDTGNVVALLTAAKYIAQQGLVPGDIGVLIVINSCEEGLGNLKGCRKIMEQYGSRVREFVTFDLNADRVLEGSVGSRRYEITVTTPGGHSLINFGRPNAIACLSELIHKLYQIKVPQQGRTTYNVGTVSGGTSVNTIAQQAQMLFEFRSEQRENLEYMQTQLDGILDSCRSDQVQISCEVVGDRPCSAEVDPQAQKVLSDRLAAASLRYFGKEPSRSSGSTDCNIPLSMGIPSVCIGCLMGTGAHTRGEKVEINSLFPGLKLCLDVILHHF